MPESIAYLIVEQQAKPPEDLPDLLKELAGKHRLDAYQCRLRLTGKGMSLLTKGNDEQLEEISISLDSFRIVHWIVHPEKPNFAPQRIRKLTIGQENLVFDCRQKTISFPNGSTILAVFADVSGALAEQSIKQLSSSYAYRGMDHVQHLSDQKAHKIILQGDPVLDLYLLDGNKRVIDAVRGIPGKFDPKGLGERTTLSSRQNLNQLLQLAKERAGEFHLFSDFGLVNLPGCNLRKEDPDSPDTKRYNLMSLARYGWLMSDLLRVRTRGFSHEKDVTPAVEAATAAFLTQNPAMATPQEAADIVPGLHDINAELKDDPPADAKPPSSRDAGLPPPPPARSAGMWKRHGVLGAGTLVALSAFALTGFGNSSHPLNLWLRHVYHSGALALLLAGIASWYSFYFMRLKRQVENTPTSRVRSLAMGMVEVKGKALRRYALVSPATQTPCIFYRLTRYRRDNNNQWRVKSSQSSAGVPFMLDDGTGRVEIDPAGCRVNAGTRQEGGGDGSSLFNLSSHSDEKWVEEIIVDGTLIYVLGFAAVKRQQGPTLTEQKIAALRELKQNPEHMEQFDIDGDGHIDQDEWDKARAAVEDEVIRSSLNKGQDRKKQEEHIVIGKKPGRPLIISETPSEEQLTTRYFYYSIPLLITALAATAWAIYQFVNYLN